MDEGAWGADYLVRVKAPGGSFYRSVSAPGPEKRSRDRRVGRDTGAGGEGAYQSSLRAGGGMAIAALARAAAMEAAGERSADYLRAAEEAWAFLAASNARLTNDGRENIVDDYCALLAATELFQATRKPDYKSAADWLSKCRQQTPAWEADGCCPILASFYLAACEARSGPAGRERARQAFDEAARALERR